MIDKHRAMPLALTRAPAGTGQFIVRSCHFCHKRTGQGGGAMMPVTAGSKIKQYACYRCRPTLEAKELERQALKQAKESTAAQSGPDAAQRTADTLSGTPTNATSQSEAVPPVATKRNRNKTPTKRFTPDATAQALMSLWPGVPNMTLTATTPIAE